MTVLRTWRTRQGLTQQALADACDVSVDTVRALEAGRRSRGPAVRRVADYFQAPVELLTESVIAPARLHPRIADQYGYERDEPAPNDELADRAREIAREAREAALA